MSQPARKKQKLSTGNISHSGGSIVESNAFQGQILAEELDLEIALRERLAATLEFRFSIMQTRWSVHLLDCIPSAGSTPGEFEDAAIEANETVETPCSVLFGRESSSPRIIHKLDHASVSTEPILQPKPRARRGRTSRAPALLQGPKFLFIRNTAVSPPIVAKMVCPDCGRSEFTNLQGLLNHARLRHKRDYGSHDECMQRCAVVIDTLDGEGEADWVLSNGIELGGVSLPSLRRLFEIAVGDDKGVVDGLVAGQEENDEDADVISSTYLSKTLGHHKDTPALAPFLGRAPKRRCINVYNEDEEVEVIDSQLVSNLPSSWRMSFPHRNDARPELDVIVEPTTEPPNQIIPSIQLAGLPSNTSGTRFHIIARVVVSDRSVWIPPDRRSLSEHTHRWIIEVDSPSYSLHISTFLAKLTVTCITDPPPPTLSAPLMTTEPPFLISGTTDKPFLAKVTLTWVGTQNAPMDVEHWVELDPLHTAVNPVLGDEQVLDVELDRHTELLPIRRGSDSGIRKRKVDDSTEGGRDSTAAPQIAPDDPYYVAKLKSLLPQYPMTLKDVKGRASTRHIPYKLVSTSGQLRSLVHGRRKAIEWGRSRALRDAYLAAIASSPPEENEVAVHLTTADVFRWLEDEALFPRPSMDMVKIPLKEPEKAKSSLAQATLSAMLCFVCGLNHQHLQSPSKTGGTVPTDGHLTPCKLVHETTNWHSISVVDIRHPLSFQLRPVERYPSNPHHSTTSASSLNTFTETSSTSQLLTSARDLVAIADPEFVMAIRTIVYPLGLSHFACTPPGSSFFPLSELGASGSEVDAQLAPYALLASVTKSFIKLLLSSGLDTANLDMSMFTAKVKAEGQSTKKTKRLRDRLLTPSHVIRGVAAGSVRHGHAGAISSLCLKKLGLNVSSFSSPTK